MENINLELTEVEAKRLLAIIEGYTAHSSLELQLMTGMVYNPAAKSKILLNRIAAVNIKHKVQDAIEKQPAVH